jgi:membrane fusion protein (multidrug efflux system)
MPNKILNKFYEFFKKNWKWIVPLTIVLVLLLWYYLWQQSIHESTDDAFIEGDVTVISPRVSGHIDRVFINDNQVVKTRDILCDLDPRDYQASFDLSRAEVDAADAESKQAGQDVQRYQKLLASKDIPQQQYDKALLRWNMGKAQLEVAMARLSQARLNLSYTKIAAPANGVITRKSVEPGMFIEAGQALMAIVFPDRWVIANFKETRMTHIRPGLKVTITVDVYPGIVFHGHVDSIQQGTGSRFSLLPAENATGNYIKVVQRVPVKIVFDDKPDPKKPLELGLSVNPTIDLSPGKTDG